MKVLQRSFLLFCLALINLTGCNDKDTMEFTDWPIIEAYLNPGNIFAVKVSRQVPFSEDVEYSSDNIDSLELTVVYKDSVTNLFPAGDGFYTDSALTVSDGDEYTLSLVFNSKDVSAYTYIPSKPSTFAQSATSISIERRDSTDTGGPPMGGSMPDPIDLTWDNEDQSYYLIVVENIEDTLDPITDFGDDEDAPDFVFRKSPNTSTSEELRPNDFQYYGTHRVILFHVLPDYADLYDQGSNSSQNLANPSTSIVNGYGIFTGMDSDTLFVEVLEAK
jgi:hypothetical protein